MPIIFFYIKVAEHLHKRYISSRVFGPSLICKRPWELRRPKHKPPISPPPQKKTKQSAGFTEHICLRSKLSTSLEKNKKKNTKNQNNQTNPYTYKKPNKTLSGPMRVPIELLYNPGALASWTRALVQNCLASISHFTFLQIQTEASPQVKRQGIPKQSLRNVRMSHPHPMRK